MPSKLAHSFCDLTTKKEPKTLITDGAPNFHEAFKDESWTQRVETRPEHIGEIRMNGQVARIKIRGDNKWLTLIPNASRDKILRRMACKILTMQPLHD
jgi:hypothetical protein